MRIIDNQFSMYIFVNLRRNHVNSAVPPNSLKHKEISGGGAGGGVVSTALLRFQFRADCAAAEPDCASDWHRSARLEFLSPFNNPQPWKSMKCCHNAVRVTALFAENAHFYWVAKSQNGRFHKGGLENRRYSRFRFRGKLIKTKLCLFQSPACEECARASCCARWCAKPGLRRKTLFTRCLSVRVKVSGGKFLPCRECSTCLWMKRS